MSVTTKQETAEHELLIPLLKWPIKWKTTATTIIYEGEVVRCCQLYVGQYKSGTLITLKKDNKFHEVYMRRLTLGEAEQLLMGKNIRAVKTNQYQRLGMNNVELLAE